MIGRDRGVLKAALAPSGPAGPAPHRPRAWPGRDDAPPPARRGGASIGPGPSGLLRYGAAAMAAICSGVRARRAAEPMPPVPAAMAAEIAEAGRPFLELPWQPAQ